MTAPDLAALSAAATQGDLIADTAADLSNDNPFWTAGQLADALLATGNLVQIDREGMRERVMGVLLPALPRWIAEELTGQVVAAILGGEHV